MQNLEKLDLVALDASELQQVNGGFGYAAHIAAVAGKAIGMLAACVVIEYDSSKAKEVKLLENVPRPK